MHFIDLAVQQRRIKDTIDANIQRVLAHGQYIMGPEINDLEGRLAAFTGTRHAISCASGTDALLMALMAHKVGPGDAVFTTPFTFMATAEVISLLGATPVFVDIDPVTYNLDPEALIRAIESVKARDSSGHPLPDMDQDIPLVPRGVIPVDLFGLPADYEAINAIARSEGLFVIEDAAQSLGAVCNGKSTGSLASVACTSFFPAKPLGCYGDGGMCFTDDDELAGIMRSIRVHGQGRDKYENIRIGINGRLDTIQAAILLAKLDIFPEEILLRRKVAQRYTRLINDAVPSLVTPAIPPGCTSTWAQYSLLARDETHRDNLRDILNREGIPSVIYYPKPLHLQPAYGSFGYGTGDFPESEKISRRIFSLPMHPYLTRENQNAVVAALVR
ncbi:MAG: DegT/DnrJ/EryC1/StrS family aminotransferase [Syntrophales bacterium]|jgi:dTDP-4-amino-4,6-dideoxygalactose transaminase|nr:DegT/DnrJ/EryC1/StrS family aminotransferase [Syntrophales bacterium]MCK9528059.1 DegT/DnrJ/EryC1/StrS family aminotransferase [Syntrophales bacterium]MDX9922345.1 DegT/DnrJ/EryC1/StrS family aminotransferase [Syntrophales bacterium]